MRLEDITIVLARPSEPGNTGAVCRAMKNGGLRRLRLAAPEYGDPAGMFPAAREKLLARAIHASDIWEGVECFESLPAALADCSLSVGTSRRRGRRRKAHTLDPRELAEFLREKNGRAALVFGNERTGLEGPELECCNMASHIPVSPDFPSINLSHAVQIYVYELYLALAEGSYGAACQRGGCGENRRVEPRGEASPHIISSVPGQWVPMTAGERDDLVKGIGDSLDSLGFYRHPGREEQERFLRDLMARAGLGLREGRYLADIVVKAGRLGRALER